MGSSFARILHRRQLQITQLAHIPDCDTSKQVPYSLNQAVASQQFLEAGWNIIIINLIKSEPSWVVWRQETFNGH
jgi:hypothetical protein